MARPAANRDARLSHSQVLDSIRRANADVASFQATVAGLRAEQREIWNKIMDQPDASLALIQFWKRQHVVLEREARQTEGKMAKVRTRLAELMATRRERAGEAGGVYVLPDPVDQDGF